MKSPSRRRRCRSCRSGGDRRRAAPAGGASAWEEAFTPEGHRYFVNQETGESFWAYANNDEDAGTESTAATETAAWGAEHEQYNTQGATGGALGGSGGAWGEGHDDATHMMGTSWHHDAGGEDHSAWQGNTSWEGGTVAHDGSYDDGGGTMAYGAAAHAADEVTPSTAEALL